MSTDISGAQTPGEQRKRQRTAKAAALDEKSGKRPKEEKKQELQKSQEESQCDVSFKNWLAGLHHRREVCGKLNEKGRSNVDKEMK